MPRSLKLHPRNPISRAQIPMAELTVTNRAILDAFAALDGFALLKNPHAPRTISTQNALVSVKLSRLRKALTADAESIAEAFDVIGKEHAIKGEGDAPTVQMNDAKEPLNWLATGTPCYEVADATAFDEAVKPLYAETVTLTAPQLTAKDLESLMMRRDVGEALDPFTEAF